MPRIFDNIDQQLLPALSQTIEVSDRADFCVGYFNLRGWKQIDSYIERWSGGERHCCRLLLGVPRLSQDGFGGAISLVKSHDELGKHTAVRLRRKLAEAFRE